ncbi:MAG TPA: prepilin-type cleavage/methylation domain-containing protein [Planctomycetaceae bacterium]|nr:prepilin-type cleavage/methylation domain-containing protein [Planctomycetaceae bacterium]
MQYVKLRKAFTLVELLVVIAIIGVMVGLLLPAVQAAREAARRMQCSNNMKQLGLGLHNYESAYNRFPYAVGRSGSIAAGSAIAGATRVRNQKGWIAVLPFIEQQALYDLADLNLAFSSHVHSSATTSTIGGPPPGAAGNPNDVVVSTPVQTFLCPSDPGPTNFASVGDVNYSIAPGSTTRQGAYTNYDFSVRGTSNSTEVWTREPAATRRMFGMDDWSRLRDVTDGTSNTVMVCETTRRAIDGIPQTWGYSKWVGNGVDLANPRGINNLICCGWDATPNARPRIRGQMGSWSAAGSLHPGGAHVTLADASVRFISDSVEIVTLQRLAFIADGQVIGELP